MPLTVDERLEKIERALGIFGPPEPAEQDGDLRVQLNRVLDELHTFRVSKERPWPCRICKRAILPYGKTDFRCPCGAVYELKRT